MGTGLKGDFLGFSFGGTHSSELGITRVSDGSRYSTDLLPTIKDSTVEVPGGNGLYYFGQIYTQRTFNISVAYDNLTEEQIRNIRKLFGSNEQQKLIFDEAPYKYYWAKSTGTSNLKFICFSDQENSNTKIIHTHDPGSKSQAQSYETGRIYKGEGTLSFICYDPFGYSVSRWLAGIDTDYTYDIDAWKKASGLLESESLEVMNENDKNATFINFNGDGTTVKSVVISNNGDVETDWRMSIDKKTGASSDKLGVIISTASVISDSNTEYNTISFENLKLIGNDAKIKLDSKTNLIIGATSDNINTNNIYNKYIVNGSFFKLPVGKTIFSIKPNANTHIGSIKLYYKYF